MTPRWPLSAIAISFAVAAQGCMVTSATADALMPDGPRAVTTAGMVDCAVVTGAAPGDARLTMLFRLKSGATQRVESSLDGAVVRRLTTGPGDAIAVRAAACFEPSLVGAPHWATIRYGTYYPADGRPVLENVTDEEWKHSVLVVLTEGGQLTARVPRSDGRGPAGEGDAHVGPLALDRHDRPVLGTVAFVAVVPFTVAADVVGFPVEVVVFLARVNKND